MAQTLTGAAAFWARMQPDQPAIIVEGDSVTYREYMRWADHIAAMLIADGLEPGDRVAVCAPNGLTYCALIMGIIRAGGIFAPINFRFTTREIVALTQSTRPRFTFASPDAMARVVEAGLDARRLEIATTLRGRTDAVRVDHDPQVDAPVAIIATSGSTAAPKGVVYTHRSTTGYAAAWALELPMIRAGARALNLSPLNTGGGYILLAQYLISGCTIYMEPGFVPAKVLRIITEAPINCFAGVPLFFEALINCEGFAEADLSQLRLATVGGARVSRQLLEAYLAKGVTLRQQYGQTEIGGNSTIMPEHLVRAAPEQCGWGNVFMDHRVVRPDGTDCAPGEQGEIIMRSPGMMQGYWNNPEETAKVIRDGWLWSGDIGVLDERGMLTFIDRLKDIIVSGGMNISAVEVERILTEFPGVEEALVIAAPDPKFGETPFAVIHAKSEVNIPDLISHCNANLSDFKVPRYVAVSEEPLPRLASGKLSKPAIRQKYADAHVRMQRVR